MKKYDYNENYFERIDSPEKAYCLGFWYADGNVINNPYQVSVSQAESQLDILKKISNIKDVKAIIYPYSFIMFGLALLPKNYAISKFFETDIYPYLEIGLVFGLSFFILLFAYFKKKKSKVR